MTGCGRPRTRSRWPVRRTPPGVTPLADRAVDELSGGLTCEVIPDPQTGTPLVIPAGRAARRGRT
jgi:hypothetical protein